MIDWTSPPPGEILGLFPSRCASAYYRIVAPLSTLPNATWAAFDDATEAQLAAAQTVVAWGVVGPPEDVQAFFRSLRRDWKVRRVLIDFDDALFAPHSVPEVMPSAEALEGVRLALRLADGVIVQNEALAQHYRPLTDAPIRVAPNAWRETDALRVIRQADARDRSADGRVIVTMAGTPSHGKDWETAAAGVKIALARRADIALRLIGCEPEPLRGVAGERYPAMPFDEYLQALIGGDIGLAPLPDSEFNRCKSPVKAYEYALAGMAIVASPTQYRQACRGSAVIVGDDAPPLLWANVIDILADRPDVRRAMTKSARRATLAVWKSAAYRSSVHQAVR